MDDTGMIKVMLIDNEDLVRRGFRLALGETPDISVVADVRVGAEALRIARERRPRVILVDAAIHDSAATPNSSGHSPGPRRKRIRESSCSPATTSTNTCSTR